MTPAKLRAIIKAELKSADMTRSELARLCGWSRQMVTDKLNGHKTLTLNAALAMIAAIHPKAEPLDVLAKAATASRKPR